MNTGSMPWNILPVAQGERRPVDALAPRRTDAPDSIIGRRKPIRLPIALTKRARQDSNL